MTLSRKSKSKPANATLVKGKKSVEKLVHFSCGACKKWWSIGDAPNRATWFCPWCGTKQNIKN